MTFAMTLSGAKANENQKDSIVCQVYGTVIDRSKTTEAIIIEADRISGFILTLPFQW